MEIPYEHFFVDGAGFTLANKRRSSRNIIGQQHAIVEVPGQCGGAMSPIVQPMGYTTLNILHFWVVFIIICYELQYHQQAVHPYVVVWDNIPFHHGVRCASGSTSTRDS